MRLINAIKRRKMEASKTSSLTTASTSKSLNLDTTMSSKTSSPCQASVETVADEDNTACNNAGQPTNPNIIIESTDEEDDIYSQHTAKKAPTKKKKPAKKAPETCDDETPKEELDEEELGKSLELTCNEPTLIILQPVCKRIGNRKYMPFFGLKLRSNTLKVASVMNLPVMQRTAKERGKNPVSYDDSWIRKTKHRLKPSVYMPLTAGAKKSWANRKAWRPSSLQDGL